PRGAAQGKRRGGHLHRRYLPVRGDGGRPGAQLGFLAARAGPGAAERAKGWRIAPPPLRLLLGEAPRQWTRIIFRSADWPPALMRYMYTPPGSFMPLLEVPSQLTVCAPAAIVPLASVLTERPATSNTSRSTSPSCESEYWIVVPVRENTGFGEFCMSRK